MYSNKENNPPTKSTPHLLSRVPAIPNRVLGPVILMIKLNGLKGSYNYLLGSIMLIVSIEVYFLKPFMHFIDLRQGILLQDWLLNIIPCYDLSIPIFILIYVAIIGISIQVLRDAELFLKGMAAYTMLLAFRYITLYLVRLEPPVGVVLLRDPFLETLIYAQYVPVKDLFFSGHTATLTLCSLMQNGRLRIFGFIITTVVAIMLLIQHAHYTIDILAAPIFAFSAYKIVFQSSFFGYFNPSLERFQKLQ